MVPSTHLALMVSPGLAASSHHGLLLQWHGPLVPTGLRSGGPAEVHLPVGCKVLFNKHLNTLVPTSQSGTILAPQRCRLKSCSLAGMGSSCKY